MAKPENPKQGCFSGFIHVLLCAGNETSPPVHPSDHITEHDETELLVHSKKDPIFEDNAVTPGLVARLMGLESLPKPNILMKGATPDSVTRSRSVNFVDYMLNYDVVGKDSHHHRRVKTSASFREVPVPVPVPAPALACRGQEENDLVVFCWDGDVCKEHEVGFELRKMGIEFEELKQGKKQGKKQGNKNNNNSNNNNDQEKKNKKISKLKNEPRRVPSSNYHGKKVRNQSEDKGFCRYNGGSSSSSSSRSKIHNNKQKKEFVESCHKKRIRKEKLSKKMESDCNSENLSPVSVLDNGTNFLDGISPLASKSKWKSSSLKSSSDSVEDSASNNKGFSCAYNDINKEAEYYSELFLKLQTLTEQDIRELDCTTKRIYEYEEFEEIGFSFEHKILDLLLHEIVNELL